MRGDRERDAGHGEHRAAHGVWVLLLALACNSDNSLEAGNVPPPIAVTAQAVATTSVRVSWSEATASNVATYELQRRADLTGAFTTIVQNVPNNGGTVVYFDNSVQAETYYGYRVVALSLFGDRSAPSTAAGTKTPPVPGIVVTVATQAPNEASRDGDGYVVSLRGSRDTIAAPLPINGERRFSALRAGQYQVVLRGLAPQCGVQGADSVKTATVTDVGVNTLAGVRFDITCRDPRRGSIIVGYTQDGDSTDPTGVRLTIAGQYTDTDPADTSRAFLQRQAFSNRTGNLRLDNLRKGSYELSIDQVDPICAVTGLAKQQLTVGALSVDSVGFSVTCLKNPESDTAGKPFVFTHRWVPPASLTGAKVALSIELDLTPSPDADALGIQATVLYPQSVLRYDSAQAGAHQFFAVNGNAPGVVNFAAANTDGTGIKGKINVTMLWFTVVGATGATARTATTIEAITTSQQKELIDSTRVREATFTVGPNPGGNVSPTAAITAAAGGTVGTAVSFSGLTSNDPDGSIVAYDWTFDDGGTASGAQVTHAYASPGTYTVTLTVRDNGGSTGTAQKVVTVTAASTSLQWSNVFGSIDATSGEVVLQVLLDLTANQADTPGPELLRVFRVDSLTWNAGVLQLVAFTFGPGVAQSIDYSRVPSGLVSFSGSALAGSDAGVIEIARLRFRVAGASATTTTTKTFLGFVLGANGIGVIDFRSRLQVREGIFVVP